MDIRKRLVGLVRQFKKLRIDNQIDYEKFYLYSIITHSTAIEGSTVSEIENQLMFDEGVSIGGKPVVEQMMNLDLKAAYGRSRELAIAHEELSVSVLKELSSMVMKNTGAVYRTALGEFSSANGDLRLVNVSAGVGGRSYVNFAKVPKMLEEFCVTLNIKRGEIMAFSEGGETTGEMLGIEVGTEIGAESGEYEASRIIRAYELSFDAHYNLVTIHPWADGNGRMARLIMNQLQFEFGLFPTKVQKEDKVGYIKALMETRESGDIEVFRNYMINRTIECLEEEIEAFLQSIGTGSLGEPLPMLWGNATMRRKNNINFAAKPQKSSLKILEALFADSSLSARELSAKIGITPKAVERQIAKLKAAGRLRRIGPDKGGYWEVVK